jgi:hypothetical protein
MTDLLLHLRAPPVERRPSRLTPGIGLSIAVAASLSMWGMIAATLFALA